MNRLEACRLRLDTLRVQWRQQQLSPKACRLALAALGAELDRLEELIDHADDGESSPVKVTQEHSLELQP